MSAPARLNRAPPADDLPDRRVPLVVDVDHTLVRADISLESFARLARAGLFMALALVLALLRGRSVAKALAARHDPVDPARLPYRADVLDLIRTAVSQGRPVILASASHRRNVARIARHLGLADPVIASSGRANLKGAAKLAAIRTRIGADTPFDYAGDSRADACLWRAARRCWSAGWIPSNSRVQPIGGPRPSSARVLVQAMRPHQWAKNGLVLVPLFVSGYLLDAGALALALIAAAAMSAIASSIYLVNDTLDIDADRAHSVKRHRPLARGDLSIPAALGFSFFLAAGGLAVGWLAGGWVLTGWLVAYMMLSVAYSVRLKAVLVGDAIALALLYTLRIAVGAAAVGVEVSYWLLLFSVFLFLSLAFLKRYVELRDSPDDHRLIKGRGYVGGDLDLVMATGVSAGMVAVLVLALFAHEPETLATYAEPELLLLLCLPLLYWLIRVWMMARRGEMDGDPVAFALRDRRSLAIGALMGLIFLFAHFGPDLAPQGRTAPV